MTIQEKQNRQEHYYKMALTALADVTHHLRALFEYETEKTEKSIERILTNLREDLDYLECEATALADATKE